MKYGIISDIHGNLEALRTALPLLEGCDEVLCVGDIVGYGPNPNECCELVRELGWPAVRGNHDLASIGAYDLEWFNSFARDAIVWTKQQLTPENKEYLDTTPSVIERDTFTIAHGSLVSPVEQYLETIWDAQSTFEAMQHRDLCFVGHTHVATVFSRGLFNRLGDRHAYPQGGAVRLRPNRKFIVNCGSIGQPRDRNPAGSLGIYEPEKGVVEIIRVPYDIGKTQAKMRSLGLPAWLINRLNSGV